jgi:hypothetical protein
MMLVNIRWFIAVIGLGMGLTTSWAGAPKLQFDNLVYDFGTLTEAASVSGTFTFSNTGDAELQVQKPAPSCGCTVASVKPDKLGPGEKGQLVFTLNLPHTSGHIEKRIAVPSNDPKNPTQNLTIKADIKQTLVVLPSTIVLPDLREGQMTNTTVQITRTDGKKLVVSKVESSAKYVRTRVVQADKGDGKMANVIVETEAEGLARRFVENVHVYLDDEPQPRINISVIGRIVGDLTVTPEQVVWIVPDPAQWPGPRAELTTIRRVLVSTTAKGGQPLEIRNPVSTLKGLAVETIAVETGKTYMVVAKLPEAPKTTTTGMITFETTLAKYPKVDVPVTINVLKR